MAAMRFVPRPPPVLLPSAPAGAPWPPALPAAFWSKLVHYQPAVLPVLLVTERRRLLQWWLVAAPASRAEPACRSWSTGVNIKPAALMMASPCVRTKSSTAGSILRVLMVIPEQPERVAVLCRLAVLLCRAVRRGIWRRCQLALQITVEPLG